MCLCIYLPRFLSVSPGKLALISEKKINLWVLDGSGVLCSHGLQYWARMLWWGRNMSWMCQTKVWTSSDEVWHFCKHLSSEDNKDHHEFSRCLWLWCSGREHKACLSCCKVNWCSGAIPDNSRITLENYGTDCNHTVLQMTFFFIWKSPQAVLFTSLFLCSGCIHGSCWVCRGLCWAAVGDPAACQTPQRSVGMQSQWVQLITAFRQLIGYQAFEGSNTLASSPTLLFEQSVARSKSD